MADKLKLVLLLLLWAAGAAAPLDLGPARLGCLRDRQDRLRPVFGVTANFLVGEPWQSATVSAACSARFALLKLADAVLLLDENGGGLARWEAPAGPALFAFTPDGQPSLVFFQQTSELYRIRSDALEPVPLDPEALRGGVVAIAATGSGSMAAVLSAPDGIRLRSISLTTGHIEREERVHPRLAPVLLLPGGTLILLDGAELVVRGAGALERRIALPSAAGSLEPLGEEWVVVDRVLAVRLRGDSVQIYRLPEVES